MIPVIIGAIIQGGFELLRQYLNKPEGWTPSEQDIADFLREIDEATPEAMKAQARANLGLPPV